MVRIKSTVNHEKYIVWHEDAKDWRWGGIGEAFEFDCCDSMPLELCGMVYNQYDGNYYYESEDYYYDADGLGPAAILELV